jgi:hypothetical protein
MTAMWLFLATMQSGMTYMNWRYFLIDRSFSPEIHALAHARPLGMLTPIIGSAASLLLWWRAYCHARAHEDDPL